MKNVWLTGILFFISHFAMAQDLPDKDKIPSIEVTGSADIEIEPDEIRLSVLISSYTEEIEKDDETIEKEVRLEDVDKKWMAILSKAGIPKSDVTLKSASTQGYWYYWWRYRDDDVRMTKQYEVKLPGYTQLNKLLAEIPGPKEGFVEVNISALKNKNIIEYRKQTKIEAMKAAKAKAQYLLESVGCTVGKLIEVVELDEDDWGWYRSSSMYSNTMSNAISQTSLRGGGDDEGGEDPSMQKIKLRYRMKARFEIQN